MNTDSISVSGVIPATPEQIFTAWLDGALHAAMTGAPASVDGAVFTAWGGYISGRTVALEPHALIEQTWRTLDFPQEAAESRLRVLLAAVDGGTRITFDHSEIPAGQGVNYEQGWHTHYLEPMRAYFGD
jgi:uncharacterized protein YndB with AHSA1/START domain